MIAERVISLGSTVYFTARVLLYWRNFHNIVWRALHVYDTTNTLQLFFI